MNLDLQRKSDFYEETSNSTKMFKSKQKEFDYEELPSMTELEGEEGQYINTLERRLRAEEQKSEKTFKFPNQGLVPEGFDQFETFRGPRQVSPKKTKKKIFNYKDHMKSKFEKNKNVSTCDKSKKAILHIGESRLTSIQEIEVSLVDINTNGKTSLTGSYLSSNSQKHKSDITFSTPNSKNKPSRMRKFSASYSNSKNVSRASKRSRKSSYSRKTSISNKLNTKD
jgi:hypothetical protein